MGSYLLCFILYYKNNNHYFIKKRLNMGQRPLNLVTVLDLPKDSLEKMFLNDIKKLQV